MKQRRYRSLLVIDVVVSALALLLSFLLRFDGQIPNIFIPVFLFWIPWFAFVQLIVFWVSGLYARIWRYTSLFDLYAIVSAATTSSILSFIFVFFISDNVSYPRSVLLLYFLLNNILTISTRLAVRVYYSHYHRDTIIKKLTKKKTLLLIGAGTTGEKIAREIRTTTSRSKYSIAGFVDDDQEKHGALLHGKKIFCKIKELPNINVKYDELLITISSASGDQMRRIIEICKQTGKRYKTVPGIDELINREVSLDIVRDVSYSDLLGRREVILDMNSIENMLHGKRILISGAGGSIGSELVEQCLAFDPSEIICLDVNEEKIYNLEQSFLQKDSNIIFKTVLGSINCKDECEKVFNENRPQIVFHAAAYKHVPIQEVHPWTAVETNIGGTINLVKLSDKYSVEKFVLVSTDKAVNPANVMGATKRAAEKIIQSFNSESKTTFMAVRFGNVLGSSGSAIPTFQKQINSGGPITITHPEMTRYFMSIQEASQLILQCGALGRDGEIFLLEMGRPIKIVQMAKDLIRLSGYEPEVDIPIVYSGLRPGEKLYEELQLYNEKLVRTKHKKIMILKENNPPTPWLIMDEKVKKILSVSKGSDIYKIQSLLKQFIPTYKPRVFNNAIENEQPYSIKAEA